MARRHRGARRKQKGCGRGMAGLARRGGYQVGGRLGYRRNSDKVLTIVATCAAADDAGVVHHPRHKSGRVMAERARLRRRQVIRRHGGARCRLEGRRRGMATGAVGRSHDVVGRLGHRFNRVKCLAAVAAAATAADALVAERNILQPAYGGFVAAVARGRGREMSARLARCGRAVVASQAGTRRQADVAERRGDPDRSIVAAVAAGNGKNMPGGLGHRAHAVAFHVTARAIAWRPLVHALNMAVAAARLGVRAGKIESRFDMVESCRVSLGRLRRRKMNRRDQWQ